jgi:hypothetical protein
LFRGYWLGSGAGVLIRRIQLQGFSVPAVEDDLIEGQ